MQSGQFGRVRRTRKISAGVLTHDFTLGWTGLLAVFYGIAI